MKIHKILFLLFTFAPCALAQHGHINAGAIDSNSSGGINAGDKLFMYFEHGTQTTNLGYNAGANTYGADGYLNDGFTTFTSLHQSTYPEETPYYSTVGPLSGSFIVLNLQSISGPTGAKFAFYDSGASDPTWIYTIGTGVTSGTGSIDLTENLWYTDSPSDPYGHIHGRRFAVDTFGTYTATWVLSDTQNGTTGLLDSDPFNATYTAIPEPSAILLWAVCGLGFAVTRMLRHRKLAKIKS